MASIALLFAELGRSALSAALLRPLVIGSVILFAIAIAMYPGGTHFDRAAVGHDFWRNTLCDVARGTALSGASNGVGAFFARTSMSAMALALGGHFWNVPRLFPSRPRAGLLVRVLGSIAAVAAIAVVLLPTDRFSEEHGIAIVIAGVPGFGAAFVAVGALVIEPARAGSKSKGGRACLATTLGVLAVAFASMDFFLYVRELVLHTPPSVVIAILERLAVLFALAWTFTVANRSAC